MTKAESMRAYLDEFDKTAKLTAKLRAVMREKRDMFRVFRVYPIYCKECRIRCAIKSCPLLKPNVKKGIKR